MDHRLRKILDSQSFIESLGRAAALAGLCSAAGARLTSDFAATAFAVGQLRAHSVLEPYHRADRVDYFIMKAQARMRAHGIGVAVRAAEPQLLSW